MRPRKRQIGPSSRPSSDERAAIQRVDGSSARRPLAPRDLRRREAIRPSRTAARHLTGWAPRGASERVRLPEHEGRRPCRETSLRRPGGSRPQPEQQPQWGRPSPPPGSRRIRARSADPARRWGAARPDRELPAGWPHPVARHRRRTPIPGGMPVGPQARRDPAAPARAQRHLRRSVPDHPLQPEGHDRRRRAGLGRGDDRPDRGRAGHRVDGWAAPDPSDRRASPTARWSACWSRLGGLLVGAQLQSIGLLFVSGMIAHVSSAAAVGRKLTMAEAWAATRGKRWRLLGMAFLLGLAVVVAVALVGRRSCSSASSSFDAPLGEAVWSSEWCSRLLLRGRLRRGSGSGVRALAVPTLMLEPVGIFGALGRAVRLTAAAVLAAPRAAAPGRRWWSASRAASCGCRSASPARSSSPAPAAAGYGLLIYLLLTAVGTVVSAAVLQPFSAAVSALLYIDQRIRKEAYDVELMAGPGSCPADARARSSPAALR